MPGALRRHLELVLAREADHLRHIVGALDERHRGGPLISGQVPGLPRLVPARLVGGRDAPADRKAG